MQGNSTRENREGSSVPVSYGAGRKGKAGGRNPEMNADEQSDRPVVPSKRPNEAGARPAEEAVEERGLAKGNPPSRPTSRTPSRIDWSSGVERIRQAARSSKDVSFTALLHHVNPESLRAAFQGINPQAAPGIDGETKAHYARELDENLAKLNGLVHRGAYKAKPSRRVYITKEDGSHRPLAVGALEDKVVQGAVLGVLEAIYEEDFLGFSYGFRPGRSQHDALNALAVGIQSRKVNWILDVDIRSFFDSLGKERLMELVGIRIADRRILRLIQAWLDAGVMEDGRLERSERGTPQGATISPLLANVYLHYVFDLWAREWRGTRARGDMIVVRYADDIVVGFQHESDAQSFWADLRARLRENHLELHPEKTRLLEFGRFATERRRNRGQGKPESFTFLGLTHICGKDRVGRFLLRRHTARKRLRAKLKDVKKQLRRRMHDPIPEQGSWLQSVIRGYFQYHAVPTNIAALRLFRTELGRAWYRTLRRRSQRTRQTWAKMKARTRRWLPPARILHPWPSMAALRQTRGRSPVR